ncbi:MAG: hypothetical protein ACYC0F_05255 [Rhodanobacter sp.]
MTEPTPVSLKNVAMELAALSYLVENILPRLIGDSPSRQKVQAMLDQWEQCPPPEMRGNGMFPLFVEHLVDALPDPDHSPG